MTKFTLFAFSFFIFLSVASICCAVEELTPSEYSSSGLRITKVMTTPKKLNALGKMSQFSDSNDVGKYTELGKDLPIDEQGEELIINWKYDGVSKISSVTLRVEYITGKDIQPRIYEKIYTEVKPGRYELALKNIGKNFLSNGEIAHWRVSLTGMEKVFAYRESRMWNAFRIFAKKQRNSE